MVHVYGILQFLSENSFIVTLVIIGLFIFINKRYGILFMKTESGDTNHCSDENCVRCLNYHDTIILAMKRIKDIKDRVISFKIQKGIDFLNRPIDKDFKQKPNVFYYDNLTAKNIWTKQFKKNIDDCILVEKSFKVISKEVEIIVKNTSVGIWKRNRTPNGSWDVFHLINQGLDIPENQELCPQTMDVINNLTSVVKDNVFGNVMISVLKPGTEITPHYGPTNIRLRCHLGLRVTSECVLTVDGETLAWERGKCLVFDDSFLHSVKHTGHMTKVGSAETVDRIVLIVDLWHPELSMAEREAINTCFKPQPLEY